jgi:hypothetical protein
VAYLSFPPTIVRLTLRTYRTRYGDESLNLQNARHIRVGHAVQAKFNAFCIFVLFEQVGASMVLLAVEIVPRHGGRSFGDERDEEDL